MYAIIEAGGRQHRVAPQMIIKMDRLAAEVGDTVEFDSVLAIFDGDEANIGAPTVEGAKVTGRVVQQGRDPKLVVFKYKPKKRYRKIRGHRQHFTQVQITDITA